MTNFGKPHAASMEYNVTVTDTVIASQNNPQIKQNLGLNFNYTEILLKLRVTHIDEEIYRLTTHTSTWKHTSLPSLQWKSCPIRGINMIGATSYNYQGYILLRGHTLLRGQGNKCIHDVPDDFINCVRNNLFNFLHIVLMNSFQTNRKCTFSCVSIIPENKRINLT